MDPNAALTNLRDTVGLATALADGDPVDYTAEQILADMTESAQALDGWLVGGGFAPDEWRRHNLTDNINFVRAAVTVTYGETGRMNATYDAGEGEPKGRGTVNGYNRSLAAAAAEAAVKAVDNWRAKTGRSVDSAAEDWATLDGCVVGRIGRNKFAVIFTGTHA